MQQNPIPFNPALMVNKDLLDAADTLRGIFNLVLANRDADFILNDLQNVLHFWQKKMKVEE